MCQGRLVFHIDACWGYGLSRAQRKGRTADLPEVLKRYLTPDEFQNKGLSVLTCLLQKQSALIALLPGGLEFTAICLLR